MSFQGRKVFTAGEVLAATDLNSIVDQSVMVFAGTAARGSAIPTPTAGMVTYITATSKAEVYDGVKWTSLGGAATGGISEFLLMGA